MPTPANAPRLQPAQLPYARLLLVALALLLAVSSGCSRLRLPAIDPTGACLCAPKPVTTSLALPGMAGDCGLFSHCRDKVRLGCGWPKCFSPEPAWTDPADPPECVVPAPVEAAPAVAPEVIDEPYVPSQGCSGACKDGPPAVMFGKEIEVFKQPTSKGCCNRLPKRGKRGCILLTPQKIVAPVGGEVILLSGICGTDGYLQMGEPLEWMLTNDSVGTFIQVGDDDPGFAHRLAGIKRAEKKDGTYARGVTSTKRTLITRGNMDARDDVELEKGQTWISLSSPNEGTSHVTVLAPESECWDNRKASATIYWIDALAQFPGPQILPAGTPAELTTRVTRAERSLPAAGWKVRYEIMQPDLATFAGTNGSSVVEVEVDESGNATAQLIPTPGTAGMATINMQVIRPGGVKDNIPTLALDSGQTFVTWSSPQLAIRAGGPEFATFNTPVQVVANVSNPGDQPVRNVRVSVQIPPGAAAVSPDAFAQNLPSAVVWDIPEIPAQQQLDLFVNVTLQAPTQLTFTARGDGGLVAEDTVRIDVFRPSLGITIQPEQDRYEAGQPVTFNIDVKNNGDRPLQNVELVATGGELMLHQETGNQSVRKPKSDGPLQPGGDWLVSVVFVPTESGRRCVNVQATADGGQQAQAQSCVTVINPIPPTPALTMTLTGRQRVQVGDTVLIRGRLINSGQIALNDVRVTMSYDPQLSPRGATVEGLDDSRVGQYLLAWTIPRIEPGTEPRNAVVLEGQFLTTQVNPRSQVILTARSAEGASSQETFTFEILPGAAAPSGPPTDDRPPQLPPAQPPPTIPGGPAPIPAPGTTTPPVGPGPVAPALPQRSQRLQLSLASRDPNVRVNDPIRYTLRVVNDSDTPDSGVSIRFQLPDGVAVTRVTQRRSPELGQYRNLAGVIYLADIRTMRPGESIDYELVLVCNQPKTFDLAVEAVSQGTPDGIAATARTTVLP